MNDILYRVKQCLPLSWRTRARRLLRVNRLALCPPRVEFLVGGTMKGGTTALSSFLDQHPEICMPITKEAHYFDDDTFRGDPADYLRHFVPRSTTRVLGDATPIYLYWKQVAARVARYLPTMKWILVLRQPVERAYSHWNMLRHNGAESAEFEDALRLEPLRRAANGGPMRTYSYLERGLYARQLRRLFEFFPRRQVLVLRSEDLRRDHHAVMSRIFTFLGVDARVRIDPAIVHAHSYETLLDVETRRRWTQPFADDIRELERLLDWDLSAWLR